MGTCSTLPSTSSPSGYGCAHSLGTSESLSCEIWGEVSSWRRAPLFPPLPAPLGMWLCSPTWELRQPCTMGFGGRFPHWRRATLLSTSSPSSFSGERSTELKIPSFQQWALPSDHQHPSRSPAKVTSTEQKTVLCLRKPLELEELRARNRRHFFCHLTLL